MSEPFSQIIRTVSWLVASATDQSKLIAWSLGCDFPNHADGMFYAVVRFSRGHLQRGDFVLGTFSNGQGERWPVYTRSASGHTLQRYYVSRKQLILSPEEPTCMPAAPGWGAEAIRVAADLNRMLARAE